MTKETELNIEGAYNSKKSFDSKFKQIFSLPEVAAPILKYTVDEYKDSTIKEIIGYIDKESISTNELVAPYQKIKSSTESKSYTELDVIFDSLFRSWLPSKYIYRKENKQMMVDFEFQAVYNNIIKPRSKYYTGRMMSSQLGLNLIDADYSTLKKAYSIWIVFSKVPKKYSNTILKFRMYGTKEIEFGKEMEMNMDLPKDIDLETIVFIMRDSNYSAGGKNEYKHPIFEYLDGILNNDKELYGKYIDVSEYKEIEGRMSSVCNMSEYFINEGVDRGIDIGRLEGIDIGKREGIDIGKREGIDIGKREGIDIGKREGIGIGKVQGMEQNARLIAERLLKQGILSCDEILDITGLSVEKLKEISDNL